MKQYVEQDANGASNSWKKIVIFSVLIALIAGTIYLFPDYRKVFNYTYEVGKPWTYSTVVAQEDFPIYKTDAQLAKERTEVMHSYTPYYTIQTDISQDILVMSSEEKDKWKKQGVEEIAILHNRKASLYNIDSLYSPKTAYLAFGKEYLVNLQYDSITSQTVLKSVLSRITPTQGVVQKGEKIIDNGDIVTEETARILKTLEINSSEKTVGYHERLFANIAVGLLITLFFGCFMLYVFVFRPEYLTQINTMLFFYLISGIIIAAMLCLVRYTNWSVYFVPILWIPVMVRVFYDSRTALFLYLTNLLIIALAVPDSFVYLLIQITVGMVVVSNIKIMTQRSQLARISIYAFLSYSILYAAIVVATTGDWHKIDWVQFIAFAANAFALLGAYGLIIVFEKMFGLTSSITLIELANISSDLMLRFAEQCEGSFQHSLQVSALATEAAKRINANVLLVRAGALYHDIGKMAHPSNFIENQSHGRNPLLDLSPIDAAQAVISHVTDGVNIARKNGIPQVIINFITTHHGDSLVKFFYTNYANAHPNEKVDESLFRYHGPRPMDKECAIVMMADGVEARSRTLSVYTEETISEMVDDMIDMQMKDHQLNNTPLSFKDVAVIKEVFKEKLIAAHHKRIKYPTLNQP